MIFRIEGVSKEKEALLGEDGQIITYGKLREYMEDFAFALGVKRQLMFCLCRNVPEAVIGYLGALQQGSVSLMLGADLDQTLLEKLIDTYRPSFIWGPVSVTKERGLECIFEMGDYQLLKTGEKSPQMSDDLALLLSTSGSTGSPKLIRLSKKNLESNAMSIAQYLKLDERERPITTLPLQYTFGLSVVNSHLFAGATVCMNTKSMAQQEFWDALKKYKATSIAGVPYTYEILKRLRFESRDEIKSLTSMQQAGGHLPVELQEYFGKWSLEHNVKFFVMYGQTEATARMSYLPPEEVLSKKGTIGKAIPGGRFEIQDVNGQLIEESGTVGELVYYGDNVSLGYATCAKDLEKSDERAGCLHTGDMACRDEDEYYIIKGRLARFIKMYGNRIGLDECEDILKSLDSEAIFACTGTDDKLKIYTDSLRWKEATGFIAKKLSLSEKGIFCRYMEKIPVKETGKKDYKKLAEPFALSNEEKEDQLSSKLWELTEFHKENCPEYAKMMKAMNVKAEGKVADVPFLPVGLFKKMRLSSTQEEGSTLTSSGTTGQVRSQIVLDAETKKKQQEALVTIGTDFLGAERLPMLIIDTKKALGTGSEYSARSAGILGFSLFGVHRTFALNEDMTLNLKTVKEFLEKYGNERFLVFGFTYIIWLHLLEVLKTSDTQLDMSRAVLVHGGGWKKLADKNISREKFKKALKDTCQIKNVHDYYGMAEQAGSIFMECEEGHLHASDYSQVIVRRPSDFSQCEIGEEGIIQVMSVIPKSYPGHSLLTEDLGMILGVDDCPCGRKGTYFKVTGRIKNAEIRGCSDTYES